MKIIAFFFINDNYAFKHLFYLHNLVYIISVSQIYDGL